MCSGSEAGSYLRLIDLVHHSTLGLRVIKKKKKEFSATHFQRLVSPYTEVYSVVYASGSVPRRASSLLVGPQRGTKP